MWAYRQASAEQRYTKIVMQFEDEFVGSEGRNHQQKKKMTTI
jgi:hypothetical protein